MTPCGSVNCNGPDLSPILGHDPVCNARNFAAGTRMSIVRFGDANQAAKTITFFSLTELGGVNIPVSEDTPAVNFSHGSFYHTGIHSWTLFEGENYSGSSRCIAPSASVIDRGYGIR